MLIMNDNGMKNLLSSQFKLGADASVAAGPVGRHAAADTDWKLRAEVLSYSRARGVFAGLELNGALIRQDKESTYEFYDKMVPFKTSLNGEIEAPKTAYPFLSTLAKWAKSAGYSCALISKHWGGRALLSRPAESALLTGNFSRCYRHASP
jgi:lipid-binding SYLF domain-containing protein